MNMQKLLLLGRATKDAELIEAKSGKPFVAFSLAVNRYLGKERGEETQFYDCVIFTKSDVEKAATTIKKGDLIALDGRPEAEAYLTKEGEPKATLRVVTDDWQVIK